MKRFKLTKCVQVVLIALLIITIGIILVNFAGNNKVSAETLKCFGCGNFTLETFYIQKEKGTHQWGYSCTICNFSALYGEETCSGAYHSNGGKCTKCGGQYETHSNKITYQPLAGGGHQTVYTCTLSGCGWSTKGSAESCSGANHANGGKCTKCGTAYEKHNTKTTYTPSSAGKHSKVTQCLNSNCQYFSAPIFEANYDCQIKYTNNNNGTCTGTCSLCGYSTGAVAHSYSEGKCIHCGNVYSSGSGTVKDTTEPTCEITANEPSLTNATSIIYTFKFNEDVKDFTVDDIKVMNGTKGEFAEKTSKREYTLVVENTESCIQEVSIEVGACTDTAGNKNEKASISITIDRDVPTCVITASESNLTNASSITYTFKFNEDIDGFTANNVEVINGIKGEIIEKTSKREYALVVKNTGSCIQKVSLLEGACADTAGNKNKETAISITIDKDSPTITVTPYQATDVKNVEVTIIVADTGGSGFSETNKYVYQVGTSDTEVPTENEKNYKSGEAFTIGENLNGTYYLWIKTITDKVGNISVVDNGKTVNGYHILGPYTLKNPVNVVEKIEISKMPNKTIYNAHEKFDATGVQVIATYTNEETKELNANEYKIIDVPDLTCKINKIEIQYTEDVEIKTEIPITVGHEEIVDKGKNPTCTEKGLTEGKHCEICKEVLVKQEEIKELGHEEIVDKGKNPTCTEKGLTEGKHCEICKEVLVKQEEIKELGHSFTKYVSNNDATCEKDGTKTAKCDRCEEKNTVVDEGSKKQHNYKDGECTYCGKKLTLEVTSSKYIIGTYITKIQPKTTVKTLKANIETNATQIKVYDKDKKILENDNLIGTGMTIEFKLGTQTITYTLVISGDANGDGKADFKDLTTVNLSRLNKNKIQGAYKLAADVNGDGKVDFKDVLKINKYRLNKIKEI